MRYGNTNVSIVAGPYPFSWRGETLAMRMRHYPIKSLNDWSF